MARIEHSCSFTLHRDEACRRLQELMARFGERYGFKCRWVDESNVEVTGRGVNGTMSVGDGQMSLQLNLTLFLTPFKSKIRDGIAKQIHQALCEP